MLLMVSFAAAAGGSGCTQKEVIVSKYRAPLWQEQNEQAPYEGWLVTQGWMDEQIELVK